MLSDERSKINDEYEKEVKALEEKFRQRKNPLLEKRNDIILGKITEFDEYKETYEAHYKECETIVAGIVKTPKQKAADEEEAKDHKPTEVDHLKDKTGIPDFWCTAIKNNVMMMQYIREKDREVLPHVTNVVSKESSEDSCKIIEVELTFNENEWFTNEKLNMKCIFKKDEEDEVQEVIGCLIDWKDGKDLTKKKIKKKQKNKKTGETRTIVKSVAAESFFNVFESKKMPEDKDDEDEEEMDKILDGLDEAMQAAQDFNDLYNFEAIEYYLNFGQNADDFMNMHGGSDDDDDDDDEEKPKAKKNKGGESGAESGDKQQECKQQ